MMRETTTGDGGTGAAGWSTQWSLDPAVTFLNHGSFGACPRVILDYQRELQDRLERDPVHFFVRQLGPLADAARAVVGAFLGADPEDLSFVSNATTGVNAVLRSLPFEPGDELLVTDHAYNACRNALDFVAARAGARVVVATVPFPLASADDAVEAICEQLTARTKLALIDHITSATGLVLPIKRIVSALRARGVQVLVDGAHAPGMVPLDLDSIGADYYTGNFHKWLCTPKGSAVLHVRRDRQAAVRPVVISHGANWPLDDVSRYRVEFDWTGTADPTAVLCAPEAIRLFSGYPGGWSALNARNRALALEARRLINTTLGADPVCPEEMLGALATMALPDGDPAAPAISDNDPLHLALYDRFGIQVPVFWWPQPGRRWLRISAQLYNRRSDYEALADALRALRDEGLE